MSAPYTLDEQADSFAEQFPEQDRAGVREWYRAQLEIEHEKRLWKRIEAGVTVFVFVGLLPTLALWALLEL